MTHDPDKYNETEAAVLGALMILPADSPVTNEVMAMMKPEYFYSNHNILIFEKMQELHIAGKPIDMVMIYEKMCEEKHADGDNKVPVVWLSELVDGVPSSANVAYYAGLVIKYHCERRKRVILSDTDKPSGEIIKEIQDLEQLLISDDKSTTTMGRVGVETYARIENMVKNGITDGIKTGFKEYDTETGGLQKDELTIIAANTSVGKTTWMANVARNIARAGTKIGYISLEQSNNQMYYNFLAMESGIGSKKIRTSNITEDELYHIGNANGKIAEHPMLFSKNISRSYDAVRVIINNWVQKKGVEVVFVDYLQKIFIPGFKRSKNDELSDITTGLHFQSQQLHIPVVVGCQLNRGAKDFTAPKLSDLRDSGTIEEHADNVVFLWRTENFETDDTLLWKLAKGRNCGICGERALYHHRSTITIRDKY